MSVGLRSVCLTIVASTDRWKPSRFRCQSLRILECLRMHLRTVIGLDCVVVPIRILQVSFVCHDHERSSESKLESRRTYIDTYLHEAASSSAEKTCRR